MASFVPPQVDHNLYKPILPQDHLMQVFTLLDQKQQLYNQGVKQAQYKVSSMLNLENEVTSGPVKGMVTDFNKKAQEQIRKYSNLDFSLQANVDMVSSVYNPLLNDKLFLQDYTATKNLNGEMAKGLAYRDSEKKEVRDMFSNTNLQAVQIKKYRLASATTEKDIYKYAGEGIQTYYEPYHDYQGEIKELFKDGNMKVIKIRDNQTKDEFGNPSFVYRVTDKNGSLAYESFEDFISASLSPKAKRQIQLEGEVEYFGMERQLGKQGILNQYVATNVTNFSSAEDLPEVKARKAANEKLKARINTYTEDGKLSPELLVQKYQDIALMQNNLRAIASHTELFDQRRKELAKYTSGEITLDQYYENIKPELLNNYVGQTIKRSAYSYADATTESEITYSTEINRMLFDREKFKIERGDKAVKEFNELYKGFFDQLIANNSNQLSAAQLQADAIALAKGQRPTGKYSKEFAPKDGSGTSGPAVKRDALGNVIPSSTGIVEKTDALNDFDMDQTSTKDDHLAWDKLVNTLSYPQSEKSLDAETVIKMNARVHGISLDQNAINKYVQDLLSGREATLTKADGTTISLSSLNNAEKQIEDLLQTKGNPAGLTEELQKLRSDYILKKEKAGLIKASAASEFAPFKKALSKYSITYGLDPSVNPAAIGKQKKMALTGIFSDDFKFTDDFEKTYKQFEDMDSWATDFDVTIKDENGKEVVSFDSKDELKQWLFKTAKEGLQGTNGEGMMGRQSLYKSFIYEGAAPGTAALSEEGLFKEKIASMDLANLAASPIISPWFNSIAPSEAAPGYDKGRAAQMIQTLTNSIPNNPALVNKVVVSKNGTTVMFNQAEAIKELQAKNLIGKEGTAVRNAISEFENSFLTNISSSGVKVKRTDETKSSYVDLLYNDALISKVKSPQGDDINVGPYKYKAIAYGDQISINFVGDELPNDYEFLFEANKHIKVKIADGQLEVADGIPKMSKTFPPIDTYSLQEKHNVLTLLNTYNTIDNAMKSADFLTALQAILKDLTPQEDGYYLIPATTISKLVL